jgi:predicted DNA-binding WGR domain protein
MPHRHILSASHQEVRRTPCHEAGDKSSALEAPYLKDVALFREPKVQPQAQQGVSNWTRKAYFPQETLRHFYRSDICLNESRLELRRAEKTRRRLSPRQQRNRLARRLRVIFLNTRLLSRRQLPVKYNNTK